MLTMRRLPKAFINLFEQLKKHMTEKCILLAAQKRSNNIMKYNTVSSLNRHVTGGYY